MKERRGGMPCLLCGKSGVAARGREKAPIYFDCPHCHARITWLSNDAGEYPAVSDQISSYLRAVRRQDAGTKQGG